MAEQTKISWTDHTFNAWWGCTAIAPGCDHCYAAALDKRTGGDYWNAKTKPRRTGVANWARPHAWNTLAEIEGKRHKVFCGSMMDWCDKDAPEGALDDLFSLIRSTPMLDWQLLTKRATLMNNCLPDDWGNGYENVWLGVTVEDCEYGFRRLAELNAIPAKIKFISAEPLLCDISDIYLVDIDWIIIGGESGSNCRAMDPYWVDLLMGKCHLMGVPVWFKQWGGNTKDKGGNKINGRVCQDFPIVNIESERGK